MAFISPPPKSPQTIYQQSRSFENPSYRTSCLTNGSSNGVNVVTDLRHRLNVKLTGVVDQIKSPNHGLGFYRVLASNYFGADEAMDFADLLYQLLRFKIELTTPAFG